MNGSGRRLAVVGNGMVSVSLLERLAALETDWRVTVLGDEPSAILAGALREGRGCDVDVEVALDDADGNPTGRCTFVVSLRPPRSG